MRHLLLITAFLLAAPALAIQAAPEPAATVPIERSYNARAHVTAEGAVEAVDVAPEVPAALVGMVRQAVETLGFQPATVDGIPAASRTAVVVKLRLAPAEGGTLSASVVGVERAQARMFPPAYPRQALVDRISARVLMQIAVLPDGRVDMANSRVTDVQLSRFGAESRRGRVYAQQLSESALQAAGRWVVQVEEVAGVPQPTHIETPVTFCASPGEKPGDCPGLARFTSGEQRRAADPKVRLAQLQVPPAAPGA